MVSHGIAYLKDLMLQDEEIVLGFRNSGRLFCCFIFLILLSASKNRHLVG
jgi:hypothetical protein